MDPGWDPREGLCPSLGLTFSWLTVGELNCGKFVLIGLFIQKLFFKFQEIIWQLLKPGTGWDRMLHTIPVINKRILI